MGEDCVMDVRLFAPLKLRGYGSVTDLCPADCSNHRPDDARSIPDIEIGSPQRFSRFGEVCHVRKVDEGAIVGRDTIPDGWSVDGVMNPEGLEAHSADFE
jgi:hypothetical protein